MVDRITFPENRQIRAYYDADVNATYIQAEGYVPDLTDPLNPGPKSWQGGRKSYVIGSPCEGAFFQMCLDLLTAFDAHKTREAFLVDGKRVFGPHISLDALQSVCEDTET
jgi:hypothetical protein